MTDGEAARVMEALRQQALQHSQEFINLTDGQRFNWQRFMLGQGLRCVSHGGGIVQFVSTFLSGISDPNRQGCRRWDFVAFHGNGAISRYHPSRHTSAEVLFADSAEEWGLCGTIARPPGARGQPADFSGVLVDMAHLNNPNLANHDKLGVAEVQAILASLQGGPFVDLTDGSILQWWRFFANTGRHTHSIVGAGIVNVTYQLDARTFWVRRRDGSQVCVPATRGGPVFTPDTPGPCW